MVRTIAEEEKIPAAFLGKTLQTLVRGGLLLSSKGPSGGYKLNLPADQISLYHVKALIDGTRDLEKCAVGLEICSDTTACPLHDHWKPLKEQIVHYLQSTTLADVSFAYRRKYLLLKEKNRKPEDNKKAPGRNG